MGDVEQCRRLASDLDTVGRLTDVDDPALARAYQRFMSDRQRSETQFEGVVRRTMREAQRAGKEEVALAVYQDWVRRPSAGPAAWTVLFRSADPVHWNTSIDSGEDYAVPLEDAPEVVHYVRLRRMESHKRMEAEALLETYKAALGLA